MIMAMKLFDKMTRKDTGPALHAEPMFYYLNRSVRLECKKIRNLLEQWFKRFPSGAQADLRGRFRSKDDRSNLGAFFELYLHELLVKSGFSVEIHPSVSGKATRPDYRVLKNGEPLFYLEATLAALSDVETSARARENQVYDVLNRMNSPNFFIGLRVRGSPNTPPQGAKIRRFLEYRLARLDPEEIDKQYKEGGFEALPHWDWEHDGWQITFFPILKKPEARGKLGVRPIGFQMQDVCKLTLHVGIRESIRDKASKYGKLDLPYIVAINATSKFRADEIDIGNALFGVEKVTLVFRGGNLIKQIPSRKPNGVWYGSNGPQNRKVSAALIAVNLSPWSIAKVTPILWHNPWTNSSLDPDTWPLPQLVLDSVNNRLVERNGKKGWQLLKLS